MQQGSDVEVVQAWPFGLGPQPAPRLDTRGADRSAPWLSKTFAAGLILFILVWLIHLHYTSLVPPVDDLEQLTWVRSLEWGYYKHPPLPTWLLWLPVQVLGWGAWTVYSMGAATTVASLLIMWRLVARLRGERHALVALLAAACITYYNGRLNYYNHNVVLMLLNACTAAVTWQAFRHTRLRWWVALGVCLGLGALAKYQVIVTYACVLAFAVQQQFWRDHRSRQGLLLATLIGLLIFSPHLQWLRTHDFGPVTYAMSTSLGAAYPLLARTAWTVHWLADQLMNRALPALLLLVWVGWALRHRFARPMVVAVHHDSPAGARALLLTFGLGPLVFMALVGLASGADLQLHWGTPFLLFTIPAIMELMAGIPWGQAALPRLLGAFITINALLLAVSHVTSPRGPQVLRDTHWRTFDPKPVASAIEAARAEHGAPIRVLSGPPAFAAAIALELPEHPLVLIDGRRDESPWLTDAEALGRGVVEIGPTGDLIDGHPFGKALPGWSFRISLPGDPLRPGRHAHEVSMR